MQTPTVLFNLDPLDGGDARSADEIEVTPKIRTFEQRMGAGFKSEDTWKRPTTASGAGAFHVRSFHCKLSGDSLSYLDKQINDWLDDHPECEVKFATTTVGEWSGTSKEAHMIVQIWV